MLAKLCIVAGASLAVGMAIPATASAGELRVTVTTPGGEPVANAVLTVSGKGKAPAGFGQALKIEQRDLKFAPYVLVAPRGATVAFPNLDQTRHHVYSFSSAGPFELKLYGARETRSVKFDKLGTIAIGCNIHDQMSAFIRVTDASYAAITNARGEAVIEGVEAGELTLEVWHPLQKGGDSATVSRKMAVPASGAVSAAFELAVRKPLAQTSHY